MVKDREIADAYYALLAHGGVGGLFCAFITIVAMMWRCHYEGWIYNDNIVLSAAHLGSISTVVLAFSKEIIQERWAWLNILSMCVGCLIVYLAVIIGGVIS